MPPARGPGANAPLRGGVDLAALAAARAAKEQAEERSRKRAEQLASGDPAAAATAMLVFDVTEATFQADIIEKSFAVPVVVDLWSPRSQASAQLSASLELLAKQDGGTWLLARVNVDIEANIAQAFRIESIPAVIAIVAGQPIPLFQGAQPEAAIRKILDELIKIATEQGMSGNPLAGAPPGVSREELPAEPEDDPRYDAAYDAFEAGDWDAAQDAYLSLLNDDPTDVDAAAGLTRVKLMRRVADQDRAAAIDQSNANPADVPTAMLAADFEMLDGSVRSAFDRLIEAVRLTAGDERAQAREHLVGLFEMVGQGDSDVSRARTALANTLF